jgi:hypothetical protein
LLEGLYNLIGTRLKQEMYAQCWDIAFAASVSFLPCCADDHCM